jgi:hypothetical protein
MIKKKEIIVYHTVIFRIECMFNFLIMNSRSYILPIPRVNDIL